jgi:hypothetical protein
MKSPRLHAHQLSKLSEMRGPGISETSQVMESETNDIPLVLSCIIYIRPMSLVVHCNGDLERGILLCHVRSKRNFDKKQYNG